MPKKTMAQTPISSLFASSCAHISYRVCVSAYTIHILLLHAFGVLTFSHLVSGPIAVPLLFPCLSFFSAVVFVFQFDRQVSHRDFSACHFRFRFHFGTNIIMFRPILWACPFIFVCVCVVLCAFFSINRAIHHDN